MRRIALACLVLIAARAPAMDLSSLPADTQWFLHLDLKTAMGGELGELVREVLGTADAKAKLGALTMITGFDPLKDLQSLTVAGSGAGEQAAVMLLQGRFEQDRLVTLVKAAEGYAADDHGGIVVHRWKDADKPGKPYIYAAFARTDLLLIGPGQPSLVHALDAVNGTGARFAAKVPGAGGLVAWGQANDLAALTQGRADAAVLTKVDSAWVTLVEQSGALQIDVALVAHDAATADQITKLAQGIQALAMLGNNPASDPVSAALIAGLHVAAGADRTVKITTGCPVATLRQHPGLQGLLPPVQASAVPEK
jgi:hypothetical protein